MQHWSDTDRERLSNLESPTDALRSPCIASSVPSVPRSSQLQPQLNRVVPGKRLIGPTPTGQLCRALTRP